MEENILETTEEENLPEAPKKKRRPIVAIISATVAFVTVAAVLLSTVFSPFGHYLSARWNMLFKNYERAYFHLDEMNKPVFDSEVLLLGFIVKPSKETRIGSDGTPYFEEEFEYDNSGNLIAHRKSTYEGTYRETYDYDDRGNLIEKVFYVRDDVKSHSIKREYDEQNNVTSFDVVSSKGNSVLKITLDYTYEGKYPASADMDIFSGKKDEEYSAKLTFSHDKKGYLTELIYKGERTVLDYSERRCECETVFSFEYDKDHFVKKLNISEDFSYVNEYTNDTITKSYERIMEYDKTKPVKLEWEQTTNGKTTVGWKEWEYDNRGNLIHEESFDGADRTFETIIYTYDKNGFLVSVEKNDTLEEYTNDKYGNPVEIIHSKNETDEFYYTEKEYEYDKNGNILKESVEIEAHDNLSANSYVVEYEDWQVFYKPIDKRNVFELYELYDYIHHLKSYL